MSEDAAQHMILGLSTAASVVLAIAGYCCQTGTPFNWCIVLFALSGVLIIPILSTVWERKQSEHLP